jgi:hypothetical protein
VIISHGVGTSPTPVSKLRSFVNSVVTVQFPQIAESTVRFPIGQVEVEAFGDCLESLSIIKDPQLIL